MELIRPIVFIDVESSGTDPLTEAIWEYASVTLFPDGTMRSLSKRFKPWKQLTPEVEALCRVKNDDLINCPTFSEFAERISRSLEGKDIGGFNVRRFDLVILDEELRRAGFRLDMKGRNVVDVFGAFTKKHPRKLNDCIRMYMGEERAAQHLQEAHGATADAQATAEVFLAQVSAHEDLAAMSIEELAVFTKIADLEYADLAGKLYIDQDGDLRYAFGKSRDVKVSVDPGYARWMKKSGGFPGSTMEALAEEFERLRLKL